MTIDELLDRLIIYVFRFTSRYFWKVYYDYQWVTKIDSCIQIIEIFMKVIWHVPLLKLTFHSKDVEFFHCFIVEDSNIQIKLFL